MAETIVVKYLENYLNSPKVVEDETKEKKFYVSDMGKCLRMRWLKRKGVESTFSLAVKWTLMIGNLYHDFGYRVLESAGVLYQTEDYVNNKHFSGRYDGILKVDGHKHLFDFKSAGAYKIAKVLQNEDDDTYISQLLTYLVMLKDTAKETGRPFDLESALLVYINKEPSEKTDVSKIPFFEREFFLTNTREQQIREEQAKISKYWEDDSIPPCTCVGWQKDYNSFRPLCDATEKELSKLLGKMSKGLKVVSTKEDLFAKSEDGITLKSLSL